MRCGPHSLSPARVSCSGRCWTGCSTGCSGCWTAGNHHYGRAHKPNASIARARRVARGRSARPARWRLTAWLSSWAGGSLRWRTPPAWRSRARAGTPLASTPSLRRCVRPARTCSPSIRRPPAAAWPSTSWSCEFLGSSIHFNRPI